MSTITPEKITRFERFNVVKLSDLLLSMLQVVAEQRGLNVTRDKGSFKADSYTFQVTFRTQTEAGAPSDFTVQAEKMGLPADSWSKSFFYEGDEYQVHDTRPRNRKYKVLVRRVFDGKIFKFPVSVVRHELSKMHSKP